jgi:hypothetical protein
VLLSDCRATDDEDPFRRRHGLPELLVLAPAEDYDQAADLAARSGARWAPITGPADAPAALTALMNRT